MPTFPTLRYCLTGFIVSAGVLLGTQAQASQQFPGALQEAADMQCVPTCLMCHTVNPGTQGTWSRPVGLGVKQNGVKAQDPESLKSAFAKYALTAPPATLAMIRAGREPSMGQDVCGPTYGCAITAPKPAQAPRDWVTPVAVLAAALTGGLLRRRVRSVR